jgi:hypothetical protein
LQLLQFILSYRRRGSNGPSPPVDTFRNPSIWPFRSQLSKELEEMNERLHNLTPDRRESPELTLPFVANPVPAATYSQRASTPPIVPTTFQPIPLPSTATPQFTAYNAPLQSQYALYPANNPPLQPQTTLHPSSHPYTQPVVTQQAEPLQSQPLAHVARTPSPHTQYPPPASAPAPAGYPYVDLGQSRGIWSEIEGLI